MTDNISASDSSKQKDYSYRKRFFTSLLVLFISFITVNLTHQLVQAGASKILKYQTKVNFVRVDSSPKQNEYWSGNRVHALYLMPMLLSLGLAVLCFGLLESGQLNRSEKEGLDRRKTIHLFLFWLGICFYNVAATQVISIPFGRLNPDRNLFYQDMSVVANWHEFSDTLGIVLAALSFIVSFFLGFYAGKHFYKKFAFTKRVLTNTKELFRFTGWLYFLPVVLLFPLILILTYPLSPFLHLTQMLNLFWICIGVYSFIELRKSKLTLKVKTQDLANRNSWDLLIVLVILIVVVKLVL